MTGTVVTFYSYKGGVGRSFALANIAVILAQWGLRVLAVDWDIEAPGLDHYFSTNSSNASPGVIDFLLDCKSGSPKSWDRYVRQVEIPNSRGRLSLMAAAHTATGDYARVVQDLNWDELYSTFDLGSQLETMRQDWIENFDIILLDSRTGITDFSGITTAQLPDILVFLFTANHQSLLGCCDVARRALEARQRIPVDRPALIPIPIPARFELREEYDRANIWRSTFSETLREFFQIWAPETINPSALIDNILIPYIPRWSFGEELAALSEPAGSNGIRSASYPMTFALETIAALVSTRLQRLDLLAVSRDEFVLTARADAIERLNKSTNRKKRVFISYVEHESKEFSKSLERSLEVAGFAVWSARSEQPGSPIIEQMFKFISESDALIVVVSTTGSQWQSREVETFVRHGLRGPKDRPILPIVLPGALKSLRSFRFLSGLQSYQVKEDMEVSAQSVEIVDRLIKMLDPAGSAVQLERERSNMFGNIEAGDAAAANGELDRAIELYQSALAAAEQLMKHEYGNEFHTRDLATVYQKIGDAQGSYGDIRGALVSYEKCLHVTRQGASDSGGNHEWQRQLSLISAKIADNMRVQGDLSGAIARIRESLAIARDLASGNPNNQNYSELVVSFGLTLGDLLVAKGDLRGAMELYLGSLALMRRHISIGGNSPDGRHAIAMVNNKIGDVLSAEGRLTEARAQYEESLGALRILTTADASRFEYKRDLTECLGDLADVFRALGDMQGAVGLYEERLSLTRALVSEHSGDSSLVRDLSRAHQNLGDVLRSIGRISDSVVHYERSLEILEKLGASDPHNASVQRDLMVAHSRLADMRRVDGDLIGALESSETLVRMAEALSHSDPGNAVWLRDLAVSYEKIAMAFESLGRREESLARYRQGQEVIRRIMKSSPDDSTVLSQMSRFEGHILRLGQ